MNKNYVSIHNEIGEIMYTMLIFKTFVLYAFIILVYRIMGKKEISELGIGDLIVTILIAELAALSIEETETSLLVSIVPILVLVTYEMIISYLSLKSTKIRRFIDGTPTVIIKDGKVRFSAMSKLRYTLDDLVLELRSKGIKSIEEVDYAILETTGDLSIFQNTKDYPLPIILDGKMEEHSLKEIHKDKEWLLQLLENKNKKLENVFYAFYTKNKTFFIDKDDLE